MRSFIFISVICLQLCRTYGAGVGAYAYEDTTGNRYGGTYKFDDEGRAYGYKGSDDIPFQHGPPPPFPDPQELNNFLPEYFKNLENVLQQGAFDSEFQRRGDWFTPQPSGFWMMPFMPKWQIPLMPMRPILPMRWWHMPVVSMPPVPWLRAPPMPWLRMAPMPWLRAPSMPWLRMAPMPWLRAPPMPSLRMAYIPWLRAPPTPWLRIPELPWLHFPHMAWFRIPHMPWLRINPMAVWPKSQYGGFAKNSEDQERAWESARKTFGAAPNGAGFIPDFGFNRFQHNNFGFFGMPLMPFPMNSHANAAFSGAAAGPGFEQHRLDLFPPKQGNPNIKVEEFSDPANNGFVSVQSSSFVSSSNVNGVESNKKGAETIVNNNGKITKYSLND